MVSVQLCTQLADMETAHIVYVCVCVDISLCKGVFSIYAFGTNMRSFTNTGP